MTANLMSEVCYGVGTEPSPQLLSGEFLTYKNANQEEGACTDIVAVQFCGTER